MGNHGNKLFPHFLHQQVFIYLKIILKEKSNYVQKSTDSLPCFDFIIKKDSNELEKLPDIEVESEHGLTETLKISNITLTISYKNKIYANAVDKAGNLYTYYLDCNDLTWHKVGDDDIPQPDFAIGKYLFFEYGQNKVYDMEKDEYTDEIPYSACLSYYGGDSSIFLKNGEWVEQQYDPETESFVTINTIGADDSDADFAIMSRTYYTLQVEDGFYLRSFEEGKDKDKYSERLFVEF